MTCHAQTNARQSEAVLVGFELGVRAWVCEAVQTIAREQMSIWGVLQLPPLLGRPERYSALGPGHLCTSAQLGDPCLASRDTSKNPPSPSGYLGLSCQGPAT